MDQGRLFQFSAKKLFGIHAFQTIVQCVLKLTELDVFYHTHNHKVKFGLHPLCPPESPCSFSSTDKILLE